MTIVTRTDGSTLEYLSAAETAKLLRKKLAKSFPGVKFWIRSETYSGGASIDVYFDGVIERKAKEEWDGIGPSFTEKLRPGMPTRADVETIAKAYAGGGFDGMIDLAYSVDRFLDDDGNVVGSESFGTAGSMGTVPSWSHRPTKPARRVSFGAKYVFVNDEAPYDVRSKKGA